MERTVQITKCIDIIELNDRTLELKFNPEINLNSKYLSISFNLVKDIIFYFDSGKVIYKTLPQLLHTVKKVTNRQFLNKYSLIRSCIVVTGVIFPKEINKEQLWQDLGNLENTNLEEIELYNKALNG